MLLNFILVIIISCADGDTIRILSDRNLNSDRFIRSERFYRKFQEPSSFTISGASDLYAKITGFTLAFHHTVPLLYKIKFDAICYTPRSATWIFPRIMVNDNLIYNDQLIQNKPDRYTSIPGYTDVHGFDHIGVGQYAFFSSIATAITKSELLYLLPGLNVIDVAVRAIGGMPAHIYFGVLTIELVEYENGTNIGGITPINGTFVPSIG